MMATLDLVITDMNMGCGRDGLDPIEEVGDLNQDVRFLVISGRREVEVAAAARADRVSDVPIKPFELERLFIAVDRALGG
jgi:DNA-binding NtrC family response regulator